MTGPRIGPAGTYRVFSGQLPTMVQALARVWDVAPGPPPARVWLPLDRAAGRVLACDLHATGDVPPFDRATVDGYAVRSADLAGLTPGDSRVLTWRGEVRMGERAQVTVGPGEAVAVATGAMLPQGADAVVMIEDTEADGHRITVRKAVRPGENVLPRGADVAAGSVVVTGGTRLGPAQVGALAGAGLVEVPVFPRPVVALVTTGDELIAPYAEPRFGQVRDMNTPALAAAVRRDGGRPLVVGRVGDQVQALVDALRPVIPRVDLVLISGGSSVGVRDITREALEALGARIHLHGIALKPGKPTLVATLGDCLLFGLPGNPVSALVIYEVFVRPALYKRMGIPAPPRWSTRRARLTRPVRRPASREELVRVRLREEESGQGTQVVADPVPGTSGMLQSLARATGLLWIPFAREGFEAGEEVEVWLLPGS